MLRLQSGQDLASAGLAFLLHAAKQATLKQSSGIIYG